MSMKVDGKRIRELRLAQSWSQETLAERAGVSLRTIQRIETGGVASLQSRRAVADALDVPASALVSGPMVELEPKRAAERTERDEGRDPTETRPVPSRSAPASIDTLRKTAVVASSVLLIAVAGATVYWIARQSEEIARDAGVETPIATDPLVVTIGFGDIENAISAAGTLRPREIVAVGARASGKLVEILVDVGDQVDEGQVLARIDARDQELRMRSRALSLEMLRNQLVQAEQALRVARGNLERLAQTGDDTPLEQEREVAAGAYLSARTDLDNLRIRIQQSEVDLEQERVNLDYTQVTAPRAGTVVSIEQKEGALLSVSQTAPTIAQIADLTTLTVQAEVFEADIGALGEGSEAYFTTLGSGDRRWTGRLRRIDPSGAATNRGITYTALFDVDNTDGEFFPNMTTQVFFVTSFAKNVLTVPVAALTLTGSADGARRATVRLVLPNGTTEDREIVIGAIDRVNAEVVSGLEEGDRVIAGVVETRVAAE